MMTTFVLVANAAEAKLYSSSNFRVDDLNLVLEDYHPDSRKKAIDLVSDRSGRYTVDSGARSAYEKNDPKKVEAEHFAQELAKVLKANCNLDEIKSLVIVVPDSLYKFIIKHFAISHHHQGKVVHISKDYTKYSLQELTVALRKHLFEIE